MVSVSYSEFRMLRMKSACEACGNSKRSLVLHHIDQNRSNNAVNNLQTLCRSCHTSLHAKEQQMRVVNNRKLAQAIPDASKHVIGPETLKRARAAFNETQGQFATRIGIKQSTLSRWENGELPKRGSAALLLRRVMDDIARVHPVIR